MAKIKILGNSVVVISSVKFEDFQKVEKYRPAALTLMGGEDGKEPIFRVGTGKSSVNEYGISFDSATRDEAKLAMLTMLYVADDEECDIEEDVAESLSKAILNLEKVEATIPTIIEEIDNEKAAIKASIEVVQ